MTRMRNFPVDVAGKKCSIGIYFVAKSARMILKTEKAGILRDGNEIRIQEVGRG